MDILFTSLFNMPYNTIFIFLELKTNIIIVICWLYLPLHSDWADSWSSRFGDTEKKVCKKFAKLNFGDRNTFWDFGSVLSTYRRPVMF